MTFNMENQKTELYLLIIVVKLTLFSLIKLIQFVIRSHKSYKKNMKEKYAPKPNQQSDQNNLTKIIVHGSSASSDAVKKIEPANGTHIVINSSDLTAHHHSELTK